MRDVDVRRCTMLERLCVFGERYRKAFLPGTVGHNLFAALRAHLDAITRAAVAQSAATRRSGRRAPRTDPKRVLLDQLDAIKAATLAARRRRDLPPVFARLRKPRDGDLAAIARSIADEATPNQALLIAHHLPATFLVDLQAAIAAFERTFAARIDDRSRRMTARADIRRLLVDAGAIARQLDVIVPNALGRGRGDVALWKDARRVEKKRGRPRRVKRRKAPVRES